MKQRYTAGGVCALMPKLTSDILALHPFIALAPRTAENSVLKLALSQYLVLVGALTLALFGVLFLFIAYGFKQHHKLLKRVTEGILFCLFVATISAVSNAVQNGTVNVLGSTAVGILLAGAIGGIIAGVGGLSSQIVGTLSPSRLITIGSIFIVVGCLIEFIQILVILAALS